MFHQWGPRGLQKWDSRSRSQNTLWEFGFGEHLLTIEILTMCNLWPSRSILGFLHRGTKRQERYLNRDQWQVGELDRASFPWGSCGKEWGWPRGAGGARSPRPLWSDSWLPDVPFRFHKTKANLAVCKCVSVHINTWERVWPGGGVRDSGEEDGTGGGGGRAQEWPALLLAILTLRCWKFFIAI